MDLFSAIWRKIKELRPNALQGVQLVINDYERAAMTAAREIFPEARLTGCWFHFNQAVLRRWRALGLTAAPRKVFGLTMALPLAPADEFKRGLRVIQEEADMISIRFTLKEFLWTLSNTAQLPEENFDPQDDILDNINHEEIIDCNLFDAHTVQESASTSYSIEDQPEITSSTDNEDIFCMWTFMHLQ
ncbi:uncharacterized protein LOC112460141 [Temnothorax curvispinosus]|uniref:Uncharacterized protein LOC112460141 n=1 Tax=Temnothorax curvispinosus TaxID=300111 RepID=A0A6J1QDP9_9HYME|nr:uncharacterized protein LOC112460141 [Temnothorax curvispinosus]